LSIRSKKEATFSTVSWNSLVDVCDRRRFICSRSASHNKNDSNRSNQSKHNSESKPSARGNGGSVSSGQKLPSSYDRLYSSSTTKPSGSFIMPPELENYFKDMPPQMKSIVDGEKLN
jgi:hypothetical protein